MAQSQVDQWCDELAKAHYMQVSDTQYAAIPREVRGVPHYAVPGVHAYLDDYENGLERARTLLGIDESHWTVDGSACPLARSPSAWRRTFPNPATPTSKNFRNPTTAPTPTDAPSSTRRAPTWASFANRSCLRGHHRPPGQHLCAVPAFSHQRAGRVAVIARYARTAHRLAHPPCRAPSRARARTVLHRLCRSHAGDARPRGATTLCRSASWSCSTPSFRPRTR